MTQGRLIPRGERYTFVPRQPGRPSARQPTDLEQRHLALLASLQQRAAEFSTYYAAALEDYVLELREAGCSARSIAAAIDGSPTTVQRWTVTARQRRDMFDS